MDSGFGSSSQKYLREVSFYQRNSVDLLKAQILLKTFLNPFGTADTRGHVLQTPFRLHSRSFKHLLDSVPDRFENWDHDIRDRHQILQK